MWGYYGSKSKVIKHYPSPLYGTVIEPFAGSAQYALKYWENDVILIDKYDVIIRIWQWLQKCSPNDILQTRKLKYGQSTDDFEWDCIERKWLVGFIITGAPSVPKKTASKWKTVLRPNTQSYKLNLIAKELHKIKHWEIKQGEYTDIKNQTATWFIDPPYQHGGEHYKHGSKDIDYSALAEWCQTRVGQVIACEKEGADWLDFHYLTKSRGNQKTSTEVMWTNVPSYKQMRLI